MVVPAQGTGNKIILN